MVFLKTCLIFTSSHLTKTLDNNFYEILNILAFEIQEHIAINTHAANLPRPHDVASMSSS